MSEEVNKIKIGGHEIEYVLRKKFSTRNLSMRLDFSRRLYISAPRLMSTNRILDFLKEKESWLKKNIEKLDQKNEEKALHKKDVKEGESFVLLGQKYKLDIRFISKKRGDAYFECLEDGKNNLVLEINENTQFRDIPEVGRGAIDKLYKQFAKQYFTERVAKLNEEHYGFKYRDIRVKNQMTRYGSCSSKGNLNFNWKVIMAPAEVVDYLLAHELSHLGQMNHSAKFWALVARACPQYEKHRKWLKAKGHTLTF